METAGHFGLSVLRVPGYLAINRKAPSQCLSHMLGTASLADTRHLGASCSRSRERICTGKGPCIAYRPFPNRAQKQKVISNPELRDKFLELSKLGIRSAIKKIQSYGGGSPQRARIRDCFIEKTNWYSLPDFLQRKSSLPGPRTKSRKGLSNSSPDLQSRLLRIETLACFFAAWKRPRGK